MRETFDAVTVEDCREFTGGKWHQYGEEALALWVADMDLPIATEIQQAIQERITRHIGYPRHGGDPEFLDAIVNRMSERFGWQIERKDIMLIPGVVRGLFAGVLALSSPGDGVVTQVPVYPPFLMSIENTDRVIQANPMVFKEGRWELDFEQLETLVTPQTKIFMLCNPQNPTGRVFTRTELEKLAEFIIRHDLYVISDELHADLIFEGEHTVFASLSPEMERRTLTLYGPGKTFNLAGLGMGYIISRNPELLAKVRKATVGMIPEPNVLSMAGTLAAYTRAGAWEREVVAYLKDNRDHLNARLKAELPEVQTSVPEGTYLQFLDFNVYPFGAEAQKVLLKGGVALNEGSAFGQGYRGFVRLNFATSRQILDQAIDRIVETVQQNRA
ncbi:MalY/PatB family protein [Deinococcus cellulosilyticus]|nr:PatB family C-S lyase [Deinococcus cellulosilyticus]